MAKMFKTNKYCSKLKNIKWKTDFQYSKDIEKHDKILIKYFLLN